MATKQTPADAIVGFLGFSGAPNDFALSIERFTSRQWERAQVWLDDAGLAFYFLQRLKDSNSAAIIPPGVLSRLERNFASNQERVAAMSGRLNEINKSFDSAGVRYEVVKGFSLTPEFCPQSSLRYQADLDYLVACESLPGAHSVLIKAGYESRVSRSGKESIFITPGAKLSRGDAQYSLQAGHAVELHIEIWDGQMHGTRPIPNLFSVSQAKMHHCNGISFPAQTDEDAFLLQVLHACRHVFSKWIRISHFLEIAYFLNRRGSDTGLWDNIEARVGENVTVREFVVIVAELASRLFAVPLPSLIQRWRARMRRQSQVWIEHYGRNWALCELPAYQFNLFPPSRLVLFLQHQYQNAPGNGRRGKNDPAPRSQLSRTVSALKLNPSLLLSREWRKHHLILRRSIFLVLSRIRYICEIPRWRWRTRSSAC